MKLFTMLLVTCLCAVTLCADEARPAQSLQFAVYELVIDTGAETLAAYQVRMMYDADDKVVGVEGGAAQGFSEPPFYDRDALEGGIMILAAFIPADHLAQTGRRVVARIHIAQAAQVPPEVQVLVLADLTGKTISGTATLIPVTNERNQP